MPEPQPPGTIDPGSVSWTVLVVDDERAVHAVTKLALARLKVEGGRLRLLHAHSGAEARDILAQEPSCALILLDVVMETEQEGLELTRWIRSSLGNDQIRIILRTGQPGRAPEASVMASYDIHDYHPKTEISAQRLRTSVTGGIRAWRDLQSLTLQRRALERVIQASGNLMQPQSLRELLRGIFGQLGSLLYPRNNALFFMAPRDIFTKDRSSPIILAGSGRFEDLVNLEVADALDVDFADLRERLDFVLEVLCVLLQILQSVVPTQVDVHHRHELGEIELHDAGVRRKVRGKIRVRLRFVHGVFHLAQRLGGGHVEVEFDVDGAETLDACGRHLVNA